MPPSAGPLATAGARRDLAGWHVILVRHLGDRLAIAQGLDRRLGLDHRAGFRRILLLAFFDRAEAACDAAVPGIGQIWNTIESIERPRWMGLERSILTNAKPPTAGSLDVRHPSTRPSRHGQRAKSVLLVDGGPVRPGRTYRAAMLGVQGAPTQYCSRRHQLDFDAIAKRQALFALPEAVTGGQWRPPGQRRHGLT